MNASGLSDYQLLRLIQNNKLDINIREVARLELESRRLTERQLVQLEREHEIRFEKVVVKSFSTSFKWILVLCPFFMELHGIIAGRIPAANGARARKQYWFYILIGYLLWTVVLIFEVRMLRQ